ncbi:MAG: hypothetical protein NWQ09_09585 [Nonlabens sp.]|nr:hypothetical protein [Nonlabens sp.]
MKTNNTIIVLLFLCTALGLQAQKPLDGLKEQFTHYSQLVMDGAYDTALDYSPEEIFTIVPRSLLINVMEKTMNDPEMEFGLFLPEYTTFEKPFEDKGIIYQVFYYKQRISLKFIETPDEENTEESIDFSNKLRLEMFTSIYGEGNVIYDAATVSYKINTVKTALAINKDGASHLYFAVIEEERKELMQKLFSDKVIKKIY